MSFSPRFLTTLPPALRSALTSAFTLVAFTLAFTALMAFTYEITRDSIRAAANDYQMRLVNEVLPSAQYDNALLEDEVTVEGSAIVGRIWRARHNGAPAALVFETFANDGYSGRIDLIVALGVDGRVSGVRVTEHHETPGLGDYIDLAKDRNKEAPWINQFSGADAGLSARQWEVKKDGGEFIYRTGATVSARAVTRAVGRGLAWVNARRDDLFAAPVGARLNPDGKEE